MNIRDAILAAADHIGTNKKAFDFWKLSVPPDCGTPACALGWIGHFHGMAGRTVEAVARELGLKEGGDFYSRCIALHSGEGWWRDSPQTIAACLRAYADKYHPATTPSTELGTWQEVAKLCGYAPKAVA